MFNILLPGIIVLIYSITRQFINKNIMNELTPYELVISTWILGGIIAFICLLLLPFINKIFNTKINYNFNNSKKYYKLLFVIILFGIVSSFCYYHLLNLSNVRKIITYMTPLQILLITLISYFIFNEKITFSTIIGMCFIIVGLIIITKNENLKI